MNIKIDANVCRACLQSGSGESLITDQNLKDKFERITEQLVSKKMPPFALSFFNCTRKMCRR